MEKELADILNRNLGNKLTLELANGIFSAVMEEIARQRDDKAKSIIDKLAGDT